MLVVGHGSHHGKGQRDKVREVNQEDSDTSLLPHLVRLQCQLIRGVRLGLEERGYTENGEENPDEALHQVEIETQVGKSSARFAAVDPWSDLQEQVLPSYCDPGHSYRVEQEEGQEDVLVDVDEGSPETDVAGYCQECCRRLGYAAHVAGNPLGDDVPPGSLYTCLDLWMEDLVSVEKGRVDVGYEVTSC